MTDPYELEIELPAMPKARPKVGRGRAYMPREYMEWKEAFAEEARWRGAVLLDEPCYAEVALSRKSTRLRVSTLGRASKSRSGLLTGDVDNYMGGVMDALEGVCWTNDRLVWAIGAELIWKP